MHDLAKTAGLNRRDQKSLANLTMRKVMAWYHGRCEAAGVPHHEKVMPHSFRIGGATALFSQVGPFRYIIITFKTSHIGPEYASQ